MKKTKILVFVLLVALCLSCFAACNKTPQELVDARDYLYNQYKEFDGKATPADFNRVGAVMINGTKYPIEWTVEVKTEGQSESVKVVKNEDGTTKRYAMWIPGWDSYYFTWMFWNFGVVTVNENGETTINSDKALEVVSQMKKWIDEGLVMWGYGSNGSSNMRSAFWDEGAFAIIHTSSQYKNHLDNRKVKGYELGVAMPPAGDVMNTTEVFGMSLCIPAKLNESRKDAAYQLLAYLTSRDVDREMASFTGFLANYADAMEADAGKAYLAENPEMANLYDHITEMTSAVQLPCSAAITDVMEDGLALIFLEGADAETQLDAMADEIVGLYEDAQ